MIRIYIGTEPAQWLPTEILKFSVLRRSKEEYSFTELKDIPLKLKFKTYTGFSFYRFAIPEMCHYEGRAIYLDADMVALRDLKELIELPLEEKPVIARPLPDGSGYYTSMMLMDCARLKHWKVQEWVTLINSRLADYNGILFATQNGINNPDFGNAPEYWNHLDHFDESTCIIHYTSVPDQPWKRPGHPYAFVYLREMRDALKEGVITEEQVQKEIEAKHVYPTILEDAYNTK